MHNKTNHFAFEYIISKKNIQEDNNYSNSRLSYETKIF